MLVDPSEALARSGAVGQRVRNSRLGVCLSPESDRGLVRHEVGDAQ
jgi:hypothetical protein